MSAEAAGQMRPKAIEELCTIIDVERQLELLSSNGNGKPAMKKNVTKPLHCPVCDVDGHDARKHRKHTEPFTKEELVAFS